MSLIYRAKCRKCDAPLPAPVCHLDKDFDLEIEIEPCEKCLDEARQEGRDEVKE